MTIIEKLINSIRQAAIYNHHDLAMPTVILWPDGDRLWENVIPMLIDAMPELFVLDENTCNSRRGPSPQLRYLISRSETGATPVIYLSGVSRLSFRGFAGFPENARHLYALQFQGQFWTQKNGKDWTPLAFLCTEDGGLGLDVAQDQATRQAIVEQLETILRSKITSLQGRTIEATDIHSLVANDPPGLLLRWMADPEKTWLEWPSPQKKAFSALCKKDFGFDPEKDGVITAAEKLVREGGSWDQVWNRFVEAPRAYGGIRKTLDLVHPHDMFDAQNTRFPQNNATQEDALRKGLLGLGTMQPSQAIDSLTNLCNEHCKRANTVWAGLGEAPLAGAVVFLKELIVYIKDGMAGADWQSLHESYIKSGWKVDCAAWKALAAVKIKNDIDAVQTALQAVYKPWLEQLADRTDSLSQTYPNASASLCVVRKPEPGTVILFVDGLRCDLGMELSEKLRAAGFDTDTTCEWAALPTITATSKPAWQPLAGKLTGTSISSEFEPLLACSSQPLKTPDFRKLVTEAGWVWFEISAAGDPSCSGWTEMGSIDHYGHKLGAKLAWRIEEELFLVVQRIQELFQNGWKKVFVTTDHGWLLLPGGLPKVDLHKHLSVSRWGRTAIAQPGAAHAFKEVPWFWGSGHSVICAPGIFAFKEGLEYTHGGLTLQETLIPAITVTAQNTISTNDVQIVSCKWKGLRLQVSLNNALPGCTFDIRTKAADAASSVLSEDQKQKPVEENGCISLVVEEDSCLEQSAVLVVLYNGKIVTKQTVTIGEN